MNAAEFALNLGDPNCAVALGGCRELGPFTFDTCAYDAVLFDGNTGLCDSVVCCDDTCGGGGGGVHATCCGGAHMTVRHASLSERDSGRLLQYDMMRVIRDPSWDLRAMLRRVASGRSLLYRDFARNSLLQSIFYCQRAHECRNARGDGDSSVALASCWQKCASLCLADAICAMNRLRPSPSHMLEMLRGLPKSPVNEHLSVVTETLGVERSTPTLLRRMAASTAGFAGRVCSNNGQDRWSTTGATTGATTAVNTCRCDISDLITRKCNYFTDESLVADCYFYLGYTNKENVSRVRDDLGQDANLSYVLRVAFDVEMDSVVLERHAGMIQESCHALLGAL